MELKFCLRQDMTLNWACRSRTCKSVEAVALLIDWLYREQAIQKTGYEPLDLAATSIHAWDTEYFLKFYQQNQPQIMSADAYSKYRLLHR